MIRTQIYLTDREKKGIEELARETGRSQSELIREAIDAYLEQRSEQQRGKRMEEAFGLWEDRDAVDIRKLRQEWERQ